VSVAGTLRIDAKTNRQVESDVEYLVQQSEPIRSTWIGAARTALSSIQIKATLLVVAMTLAVTIGVAAYLLDATRQVARHEYDLQLLNAASLFAKAVEPHLSAQDVDALSSLVKGAADGSPFYYVVVTDVNDQSIAQAFHRDMSLEGSSAITGAGRRSVPGRPMYVAAGSTPHVFLDVSYPVTSRGDDDCVTLLGYVRTGMIADAWQRSLSTRLDMLIGVGAVALVLAIPLGFLLVRQIVSPLDNLADVMRRFANGCLGVRAQVGRDDEIGRLSRVFNQMADQHQYTHERIVRLNAELEERVAYRTQQLRELASREPLTGLYNRRHFREVLERRFAEAVRYATDLSCVMIDLDEFKSANDQFGHHVGDELLILVAMTILGQLRTADVAARYGGDEFIVLLPQTDCERASILAERIVAEFAKQAQVRFPQTNVSMSIGIANLHTVGVGDAESLIRAADRALYRAKGAGKNRIIAVTESSNVVTL